MDLNYRDTLIAVAEDCPVDRSRVPVPRGNKATVAVLQYEMLVEDPYRYSMEDVLFESWLRRQARTEQPSEDDLAPTRAEFLAKPQACLRSSPLPKRYGWGFLFRSDGKVALCPMESDRYQDIVTQQPGDVKILRALRSTRA
jgi:hypothetical protein